MRRHELTDDHWERLIPLLPPQRPNNGRPAKDHRIIINGILWVLKTGAPWRDLPERYRPWQTVYSRIRRWQQAGVLARILAALQRDADAAGQIDWHIHPGWLLDQGPCPRRRLGQADHVRCDTRPVARPDGGRTTVRAGCRASKWSGSATTTARATGWRPQLQQPALSQLSAPPQDPADDPAPTRSSQGLAVRPQRVSPAQPDRTADQSPQAVPAHRDPLREVRGQLPGHADGGCDHHLVVTFAGRP